MWQTSDPHGPSSLLLEELCRRQPRCACSEASPTMVSCLPFCWPSSSGQPGVLVALLSYKSPAHFSSLSPVLKFLEFSMWEPMRNRTTGRSRHLQTGSVTPFTESGGSGHLSSFCAGPYVKSHTVGYGPLSRAGTLVCVLCQTEGEFASVSLGTSRAKPGLLYRWHLYRMVSCQLDTGRSHLREGNTN